MRTPFTLALAASLALGTAAVSPPPAFAQDDAGTPACQAPEAAAAETPPEQPKRKKKGLGLGGLLSAARQAGLGDVLSSRTGGMFGGSKIGSIAGSVAGTAINAAETGHVDGRAIAGSMMGSGTAGQIAGAVTGTAIELAASAAERAPTCAE